MKENNVNQDGKSEIVTYRVSKFMDSVKRVVYKGKDFPKYAATFPHSLFFNTYEEAINFFVDRAEKKILELEKTIEKTEKEIKKLKTKIPKLESLLATTPTEHQPQ